MRLITASKAAIKEFRYAFKNPTYISGQPLQLGSDWIFPIGRGGIDKDFTRANELDFFTNIPEVNIVLNYRARAFSNMKLDVFNKKTGEIFTGNTYLSNILKTPNFFQGIGELLRQSSLFHDIHGNEYSYFLTPFGMGNNVKAWYTIPPALLTVTPKLKTPYFLETESPEVDYVLKWGNVDVPLEQSAILHINDNKVNVSNENWITGESKLKALKVPCINLKAAYEARNVIITNYGATGMITPDKQDASGNVPLTDIENKEVQENFRRYGLSHSQWQTLISRISLKYTQMGIDANKLQLFTEVENDTIKICDAYGFPYRLLANIKAGNLGGSDIRDLQQVWYLNSIIPETMEKVGLLNKFFETDKTPYEIRATYDHLYFFSEDKKDKASTIQIMVNSLSTALADEAITLEEYQQILQDYGVTAGKAKRN